MKETFCIVSKSFLAQEAHMLEQWINKLRHEEISLGSSYIFFLTVKSLIPGKLDYSLSCHILGFSTYIDFSHAFLYILAP